MTQSNTTKEKEKDEHSDAGSFETAHTGDELEVKTEVKENSTIEQNCANGENIQERRFRGQRGGRRRNQFRNASPEQKPIVAQGLKGSVAWYSVRDCYGFIKRGDGEKDVFVHQMAIAKSYLRQQRYRSLAEGEEVWFDLAKGREERLQAANVTGPEGKHVIGTPIVIHRVGGRNGPRVVGIEEDVGYRRFGRFRRDRRRRAASRDQETQSSAAPDTQVSKQSNEKTTENSAQKQNRSNSINNGAGKTNRRGNHDQHVVEIEDGSGDRRERSGRFRRGRRRYRSPINKETRQNSEKSAAQQSKHPQSNGKTPETSAQKQELASSMTNDETVPIRIEVIQE